MLPRITSATDRERHENPARPHAESDPERRALVVHEAQPDPVRRAPASAVARHELGDRQALRDDVGDARSPTRSRGRGRPLRLLLSIFFTLLARDAEPRVRQRIEAVEIDLVAAADGSGRTSRASGTAGAAPRRCARGNALPGSRRGTPSRAPSRRCPGPPCGTSTTRGRRRRSAACVERLAVLAEFLQHAPALLEQPLLEVREQLLAHRLDLGRLGQLRAPSRASRTSRPWLAS